MEDIYIVGGARTAIGDFGGSLKPFKPSELGSIVVKEALARAGVPASDVGHVVIGQVMPTSARDGMLARTIGLNAGVPLETPALTLNRLCGSGVQAIVSAAQMMKLGEADITVAGGAESMSNVPYHDHGARWGRKMGDNPVEDALVCGLQDASGGYHMGVTAENCAERHGITREQQDALAVEGHQRAVRAIAEGRFKEQIVPVEVKTRKGVTLFDTDEHPRADTSLEMLAAMRPAFKKDGSVTAGNASGINDGAAALVVATGEKARKSGTAPLARILSYASTGVDPRIMGMGPVPAVRKALERAGLTIDDVDLFELNEAFAAQSLAVMRELGLDPAKVNIYGGAIALGHPIGASGARILTTLVYALRARKLRYGVASLCIGGGMGIAMVVEAL